MIVLKCQNARCAKSLTIQDELAGKNLKCPTCGAPLAGSNAGAGAASSAPAASTEPRFYFMQSGKPSGPVSLQQMQQRVAAGALRAEDPVWQEGAPQWVKAREVRELFAAAPANRPVEPALPPRRGESAPVPDNDPPPRRRESPPDHDPPPRRRPQPAADSRGASSAFGMSRFVYWSSLTGGWSAFIGWLLAEMLIGRWVAGHFLIAVLMILFVASALGAGLSQAEALITSQWKAQRRQLGFGLLGGFVGGLLGGLLGNLFYLVLGGEVAALAFIGRLLGWTLLGTCIGICEGLLRRHWRRFRNGLIGGSIGGFLGGLFFNPVSYLIGSPLSSRAFAFVLLGMCIGLFVGLVQVLLKEAWITVQAGFRPGRQLILNDALTTMGTSEKANLIFIAYGAKGVEPIHLRIRRSQEGAYYLEDNDSREGTYLNDELVNRPRRLQDGDVIRFGVNEVRFQQRYRARQAQAQLAGEG